MRPGRRFRSLTPRVLPWLLLAAAIGALFAVEGYVAYQITLLTTYAIAIMGLNLSTAGSGQVSLGHGAFCAIGAYTAAVLMTTAGVGYPVALAAAGAVALVAGWLVGLPAARLDPVYTALATFALAIAAPQVLKLTPLAPWTGGAQGLAVAPPAPPPGLPLAPDHWLCLVTLLIALLLYAAAGRILDSTAGLALRAIRDDPVAAAAIGIDTSRYKAAAFAVSAAYAGIAGALAAMAVQYIAPDSFPLGLSISILVGMVVGGVGWLPGSIIGGAFLVLVPNVAEQVSKGLSGAIYGAILLLVVYLMPEGVGGLYRRLRRALIR